MLDLSRSQMTPDERASARRSHGGRPLLPLLTFIIRPCLAVLLCSQQTAGLEHGLWPGVVPGREEGGAEAQ